jgi:uncharacterized protein with PQ loop repeat
VGKNTKNNKSKINVDNFIYFFAFTTPLFEIPQFYAIVHSRSAEHVSLITWAYLALASAAWLIYGIVKRIKPLIASYILYTAVETGIVIAIFWFK